MAFRSESVFFEIGVVLNIRVVPKGPFRTKNSTESESRYGEQIRYGRRKTLRRGLRSACFSRKKRQENGVRILKNYGSGKIVRIRAPYYF